MDKLQFKMKKRCDEDEYPPGPAQRAAGLVKGGQDEEEKDHLGATELKAVSPGGWPRYRPLRGPENSGQREWYRRGSNAFVS